MGLLDKIKDAYHFWRGGDLALHASRVARAKDEREKRAHIDKGLEAINKKLEEHPNHPVYLFERSCFFIAARDYERAKQDLEQIDLKDETLRIAKKEGVRPKEFAREVYASLADTELHLGNHDQAARYGLKCLFGKEVSSEILQDPAHLHFVRALAFRSGSEIEKKREDFEEALKFKKREITELERFLEFLESNPDLEKSKHLRELGYDGKRPFKAYLSLIKGSFEEGERNRTSIDEGRIKRES